MKKFCLLTITLMVFLSSSSSEALAKDVLYRDAKYAFSIAYPSGWRIVKNVQKAPLTIFFPKKRGFDIFNENISIGVTSARSQNRPLEEIIDIYFKYSKTVLEKKKITINGIEFLSVVQNNKKKIWFFDIDLKMYYLITVRGARIYTLTYTADSKDYDSLIAKAKDIMHTFRFF